MAGRSRVRRRRGGWGKGFEKPQPRWGNGFEKVPTKWSIGFENLQRGASNPKAEHACFELVRQQRRRDATHVRSYEPAIERSTLRAATTYRWRIVRSCRGHECSCLAHRMQRVVQTGSLSASSAAHGAPPKRVRDT